MYFDTCACIYHIIQSIELLKPPCAKHCLSPCVVQCLHYRDKQVTINTIADNVYSKRTFVVCVWWRGMRVLVSCPCSDACVLDILYTRCQSTLFTMSRFYTFEYSLPVYLTKQETLTPLRYMIYLWCQSSRVHE